MEVKYLNAFADHSSFSNPSALSSILGVQPWATGAHKCTGECVIALLKAQGEQYLCTASLLDSVHITRALPSKGLG